MMEANTSLNGICKPEPPELNIARVGKLNDLPELLRLTTSQQAAAGKLAELNLSKITKAFGRAIANDRSMILVAPGTGGRLNGFLLIGLVEEWFSNANRISQLCVCVDRGHLRSKGVRELKQFADWARKEAGSNSDGVATLPANPLGRKQKRGTETQEKGAHSNEAEAIELLQTLAQRNRQPAMSNGDASA
jgi:hypothetical protein